MVGVITSLHHSERKVKSPYADFLTLAEVPCISSMRMLPLESFSNLVSLLSTLPLYNTVGSARTHQ